ncbi:MAG: S-layer protein [Candidatus Woesearchaeota archaeon]
MFVVKYKDGKTFSLPSKQLKPHNLKGISTDLAQQILYQISKRPSYPKEIAKNLRQDEQKIYYHIHNLEKNGIINVISKKVEKGGKAKVYDLAEPSFFLSFKEFEETQKLFQVKENYKRFLEPFIEDGILKALIIVGSPDPHGPEKARSRDGYYGIDLALFFGTFLNYVPNISVKLDTETRAEDLKNNNIILIGGPVVNSITAKINSKLSIRFEQNNIKSTISNKTYTSEETGLIVKLRSPFNPEKSILVIAGKRFSGTRATIISFIKHFDDICMGNRHNSKVYAKVVEGTDLDSDGIVDDVEILE